MTARLRDALHEVADRSPAMPAPKPGLFERARRAQVRRRIASGALALLLFAGVAMVVRPDPPALPATGVDVTHLPRFVMAPPKWTARLSDAPIERALAAFVVSKPDGTSDGELVLVGPKDQYRSYPVPDRGISNWTASYLLSPDGRDLMVGEGQRTKLVHLATGDTRTLAEGAPLAWSPDGSRAVLAHFDSETTGQLRVVEMPSGRVLWRVDLKPGPDARSSLLAALSPDSESLAVQHFGELYRFAAGGKQWSTSIGVRPQLAGQLAWTPDGRRIALSRVTYTNALVLVDAADGSIAEDVPGGWFLGYVGDQGHADGLPIVVGWDRGQPVVNAGNKALVKLGVPHQVLTTAADRTYEFQVAGVDVEWVTREPGEIDTGTFAQRYHPLLVIAAISLLLLAATLAIIRARRRAAGR